MSPQEGATLTYSLVGGADQARFRIDTRSGELSFIDNTGNGGQPWPAHDPVGNNDYRVDIQAHDGTRSTMLALTVTVTDVFNLSVTFGIKTLQFTWFAVPGAAYYKLLVNPDGNKGFQEVPGASRIEGLGLGFDHYIALHRFDAPNARYMLEAYDSNNNRQITSSELSITTGLNSAIGYVKSTQTTEFSTFGRPATLSADGNTLAVGAYNENGSTGAVYVYRRTSGAWQPQDVVTAPNSGSVDSGIGYSGDRFGWAVALSADGATLVVGAPYEDSAAQGIDGNQQYDCATSPLKNCASAAGAVYVYDYVGNASAYALRAYVKAPNSRGGYLFGWAVALSTDGATLAVGAPHEDSAAKGVGGDQQDDCYAYGSVNLDPQNCATDSGAVYLFSWTRNSDRTWGTGQFTTYLKGPDSWVDDQFGMALALSADGATLAVGASLEDSAAQDIGGNPKNGCADFAPQNCATDSGAVHLFDRVRNNDGTWGTTQLTAYLKAPNSEIGNNFGQAVTLSADGATLAVGASLEDSAAQGIGGNQQNDCKNADGSTKLNPQNCTPSSGAVYLFDRVRNDDGTWSAGQFTTYLKAPNSEIGNNFGQAVALSADGATLAVGARGDNSAAQGIGGDQQNDCINVDAKNCALDSGAVYLY